MRDKILVVDDIDINREILKVILCDDYDVDEAEDGVQALELLNGGAPLPQLVLLDIMMPKMNGYEVLNNIKKNPETASLPVLIITAESDEENESKAILSGAVDFINKPFNSDVVKARVDMHIQLSNYRTKLEEMVRQKTEEVQMLNQRILETLATIVEYRSLESGHHIRRVQELTRLLIEKMLTKPRFRDELIALGYEEIIAAAVLHDVGKVGISDEVLLKPGKLTEDEFEQIKRHPDIGSDIIDTIAEGQSQNENYLKHCRDIALYHHERWDGTGYGRKLAGKDIPLSARILSLIDVYDALTTKRCYKDAFSHERTMDIINRNSGTQFDPDIVDCFNEISDDIRKLAERLTDDNTILLSIRN